jgi:vitamin B12 transporter
MHRSSLRSVGMGIALLSTTAWFSPASAQVDLGEVVITPSGRPEPRSRTTGTVQVIGRELSSQDAPVANRRPAVTGTAPAVVTPTGRSEPPSQFVGAVQVIEKSQIEHSTAKSVADILAEYAVGFLSEWTPGQTSINIRGAATDGQGRDFKSQVLVLINGHRAGTANVAKLSLAEVDRIEIVRGPASVIYGSQNMGGVINIIMKTGLNAPGTFVEGDAGSWGLARGKVQNGGLYNGVDWFAGVSGGRRDDFHISGGGTEGNTAWKRASAASSLGYQVNANNRFDFNVRSDGVYDTGFRGSSANLFAFDNRYNQSFDFSYTGGSPDQRFNWFFQTYGVNDVDDLNNPSPLSAAVIPRTSVDRNRRQLDIFGTRFQPRAKLWSSNELLLGWDLERSKLRSDRGRLGLNGVAVAQLAPTDNNQNETVNAFYFEDVQTFFDDRLTVRGGMRRTKGTTFLEPTPYAPTLIPGQTDYQFTTQSMGSSIRALDWLTFRVGASTGFRAPTATELGANFTTAFTGNVTFGNPGLQPESSRQIEAGATVTTNSMRLDASIFKNTIMNRITTQVRSSTPVVTISDTVNNPGDIIVQGIELQSQVDILKTFAIAARGWRWSAFTNAYYHFNMVDRGAPVAAGSTRPVRIYEYEAAIGTRFGESGSGVPWRDWSVQIIGNLRGPMWYNTEERLLLPGQLVNVTVYRKSPFWVWNTRYEVEAGKGWTVFAAVNNIFDINQHPIFIALDQTPCIANPTFQNGGCGNSMPGREFIVGVQGRW